VVSPFGRITVLWGAGEKHIYKKVESFIISMNHSNKPYFHLIHKERYSTLMVILLPVCLLVMVAKAQLNQLLAKALGGCYGVSS